MSQLFGTSVKLSAQSSHKTDRSLFVFKLCWVFVMALLLLTAIWTSRREIMSIDKPHMHRQTGGMASPSASIAPDHVSKGLTDTSFYHEACARIFDASGQQLQLAVPMI